ncbi:MAG: hypothetical protein M0R38_09725 [Bacteroidia bacterium]|nr:hypothetical protein [Bacteroidia bacterium]
MADKIKVVNIIMFFTIFCLVISCNAKLEINSQKDLRKAKERLRNVIANDMNQNKSNFKFDLYGDKVFKEKVIGNIRVTAKHLTAEEMAIRSGILELPIAERALVLSEYEELKYFELKFETVEGKNPWNSIGSNETMISNTEKMRYFNFKFNNNIFLKSKKSKVNCELFHFEGYFPQMPYLKFLVGFPVSEINNQSNISEECIIEINDELFGIGRINMSFHI